MCSVAWLFERVAHTWGLTTSSQSCRKSMKSLSATNSTGTLRFSCACLCACLRSASVASHAHPHRTRTHVRPRPPRPTPWRPCTCARAGGKAARVEPTGHQQGGCRVCASASSQCAEEPLRERVAGAVKVLVVAVRLDRVEAARTAADDRVHTHKPGDGPFDGSTWRPPPARQPRVRAPLHTELSASHLACEPCSLPNDDSDILGWRAVPRGPAQ